MKTYLTDIVGTISCVRAWQLVAKHLQAIVVLYELENVHAQPLSTCKASERFDDVAK
jgi:hypothetical protein